MKKLVLILVIAAAPLLFPFSAYAISCGFGSDIGGGVCRGYLYTTSGPAWTVPSDWNSGNNTIEIIGGGGGGGGGYYNAGGAAVGSGGGGGAYSKISNLPFTPNTLISLSVGAGGGGAAAGSSTYFDGTSCTGSRVCAQGGSPGSVGGGPQGTGAAGGVGGSASSGVGSVLYSGGAGSSDPDVYCAQFGEALGFPGGGGGAAGPNGNGTASSAANPSCSTGISGGDGDAGYGGAGSAAGSPGYSGNEWATSVGSGGGAGGTCSLGTATGGGYGGGGGGTCDVSNGGGPGIIVITYTPALQCSISLLPNPVAYSASSTLKYSSSGAQLFFIYPGGYQTPVSSGTYSVSPPQTTEYTGTVSASSTSYATQSYTNPGTYTFTVPTYSTLIVTVNGAGGGGTGYMGASGSSGQYSSFGSMVAYAGGGATTAGPGAPGTAKGGDTNTTGGGSAGGAGGGVPAYAGGNGGQSITTYASGALSASSTMTIVVGAGGAAGSLGGPGANGSVTISWKGVSSSISSSCFATLTVTPPLSPTASIAASSTTVIAGQPDNITASFNAGSGDTLTADNIDEPIGTGQGATIDPDASKTISFSTTTPGTYTFYAMASTTYYDWAPYASTTVTVNPSPNCTLGGVTVPNNSSNDFYSVQTAPSGQLCQSYMESRTCSDGTFGGDPSYQYGSCSCTPTTVYSCSGDDVAQTVTDSSCNVTINNPYNGQICAPPESCIAPSSECQAPSIFVNPTNGHSGNLQIIPTTVLPGGTTEIYWNVGDAQNCKVSGSNGDGSTDPSSPWNQTSSPSGGQTTSAIDAPTTYTLSCTAYGSNSNLVQSATVNIAPTYHEE